MPLFSPSWKACMEPIVPLSWILSLYQRSSSINRQLWAQKQENTTEELSVFPGSTLTSTVLQNHIPVIWPSHKALLGSFFNQIHESSTCKLQRDLSEGRETDNRHSCFLIQLTILFALGHMDFGINSMLDLGSDAGGAKWFTKTLCLE